MQEDYPRWAGVPASLVKSTDMIGSGTLDIPTTSYQESKRTHRVRAVESSSDEVFPDSSRYSCCSGGEATERQESDTDSATQGSLVIRPKRKESETLDASWHGRELPVAQASCPVSCLPPLPFYYPFSLPAYSGGVRKCYRFHILQSIEIR